MQLAEKLDWKGLSNVACQSVKIYVMFVHTELNKKPEFNTQCMFKSSSTMIAVPYRFH
jgi:hypothetical protein